MNYLISKITKLHKFKNARLRKKTVIVQAQIKKKCLKHFTISKDQKVVEGGVGVRVIPALGIGCGGEAGVQGWDYG